jgi:hypothetical protein
MESHKIQRLEFISDKIEGGDCKREVICISFGHPTKKNGLCEALHGRGPWSELERPWEAPWGARRRGRGRRRGGIARGQHGGC